MWVFVCVCVCVCVNASQLAGDYSSILSTELLTFAIGFTTFPFLANFNFCFFWKFSLGFKATNASKLRIMGACLRQHLSFSQFTSFFFY